MGCKGSLVRIQSTRLFGTFRDSSSECSIFFKPFQFRPLLYLHFKFQLRNINTIFEKICHLALQIILLIFQLGKEMRLPKHSAKGNLLNTLFLFFIGIIERLQDFEHGNFKMATLFHNRIIRKGLMLFTCLLFFLTSFEQPVNISKPLSELSKIECSLLKHKQQVSVCICLKKIHPFVFYYGAIHLSSYCPYYNIKISSEIFLQNRCLLI